MGSHRAKVSMVGKEWGVKNGVAPRQSIDNKYIIRKYMYFSALRGTFAPPEKAI